MQQEKCSDEMSRFDTVILMIYANFLYSARAHFKVTGDFVKMTIGHNDHEIEGETEVVKYEMKTAMKALSSVDHTLTPTQVVQQVACSSKREFLSRSAAAHCVRRTRAKERAESNGNFISISIEIRRLIRIVGFQKRRRTLDAARIHH